jgi:hypothetical protein
MSNTQVTQAAGQVIREVQSYVNLREKKRERKAKLVQALYSG